MIKLYQWFHSVQKICSPGVSLLLFLVTVFGSSSLNAQTQQAAPAASEITRAAQSIAKTMDPNTYVLMMMMSMVCVLLEKMK